MPSNNSNTPYCNNKKEFNDMIDDYSKDITELSRFAEKYRTNFITRLLIKISLSMLAAGTVAVIYMLGLLTYKETVQVSIILIIAMIMYIALGWRMKATNKTLKEYLSIIYDIAEKEKRKAKNIGIRFIIATALFIVISTIAIITGYFMAKSSDPLKEQYDSYITHNGKSDINQQLLQYDDTYDYFIKYHLGNNNAITQTGGYFAAGEDFYLAPNAHMSCTEIVSQEGNEIFSNELCSYISIVGDSVYYRQDNDRNLYRRSLKNGNTELLLRGNIGQFIICDTMLYYIDYEQNCSLVSMQLTGEDKTIISDKPVHSFALIGNDIFFLTDEAMLYTANVSTHEAKVFQKNVERFFFNGKLIIQNNGRVIMRNLESFRGPSKRMPIPGTITLVSADNKAVYYQMDSNLYAYNIDSQESVLISSGYDIYRSIFQVNDKYYIVAANTTTDIQKEQLLTLVSP